jgi:hypothetical protein
VPGVNLWHRALAAVAEVKPAEVRLAFDADKNAAKASHRDPETDEPVIVGKAVASLYLALKAEGFKVVIENWPTEDGKGIDDARRTP